MGEIIRHYFKNQLVIDERNGATLGTFQFIVLFPSQLSSCICITKLLMI